MEHIFNHALPTRSAQKNNGTEGMTLPNANQTTVKTVKVEEDQRIWDWTEYLPQTPHIQFFRSVNWSATLVGPIDDWDPVLRQATYQLMADSRPATLYWYSYPKRHVTCP
jgi:hypothetical protein